MLLKETLKKRVIILDGPTGTELQKKGMPTGVCPEIWCIENSDVIGDVHAAYRNAGSDIIYTATFGANSAKLGQYGDYDAVKVNRKLSSIAKHAAGDDVLVCGDIGPTGRFIRPFGDLDFEEAVEIYKEQVKGLLNGGVDLFVIETMIDIQEARAALIAVKELTDKFTIVTMTYEGNGRTLNGTDPVSAIITLQSLGADAAGCNCSSGPKEMMGLIEIMKPWATVPLVAKPNAGMPEFIDGRTVFSMEADTFSGFGREFVLKGVNLLGGCCGTTPEHIRMLKEAVDGMSPVLPLRNSISALSSARSSVILEGKRPLAIVGERINPTGKKDLQRELLEGGTSIIRAMAGEQEKKGAALLDVNVGISGIDEKETMLKVISDLSVASGVPLVIDSSNIDVIEAALRLYPGRALINSISGEKVKTEKLLPIAAKYGAMFILLPLSEGNIPEKAKERQKIVEDVFEKASALGFTKADVIVDGLVMAASSNPGAPLETLETVEWSAMVFGVNTIVGLSNVSFGMPERKWLNATFLAMAVSKGLTMAIANPGIEELMNIRTAGDLLAGRDDDASGYIKHFSNASAKTEKVEVPAGETQEKKIFRSIIEGSRDGIEKLLLLAMDSGANARKIVDEIMIPAITEVGALFDKKEYFLPQLIASAETMKKGIACLEPWLKDAGTNVEKKGLIVIATVRGDIHDIGKNIVALMLGNHGFEVVDLGKDVSAETIVREAARLKASVVCLSALMTTTMVNMEEVVELAKKESLDCDFMVGGAVITKTYAGSIGAHYAKDGVEATRVAKELVAGRAQKEK